MKFIAIKFINSINLFFQFTIIVYYLKFINY